MSLRLENGKKNKRVHKYCFTYIYAKIRLIHAVVEDKVTLSPIDFARKTERMLCQVAFWQGEYLNI